MTIIVCDNNLNWSSETLYFGYILLIHHHIDTRMELTGKKSKTSLQVVSALSH